MADAAVTAARGISEAARSMEGGDMDASLDRAGGADADDEGEDDEDDDGGGGGEKAGVR